MLSLNAQVEIVQYRPDAPTWERVLLRVYQTVASPETPTGMEQ